jgi:hypothetical protein
MPITAGTTTWSLMELQGGTTSRTPTGVRMDSSKPGSSPRKRFPTSLSRSSVSETRPPNKGFSFFALVTPYIVRPNERKGMIIQINTRKMMDFVRRHREAIAVACIAAVVIHSRDKDILSMSTYIQERGLARDYDSFTN